MHHPCQPTIEYLLPNTVEPTSGMSVTSLLSRIKEFVVDGRKRKSDEPSEASTISFAKYRRITDDFPKFISTPLSNDYYSKSEPTTDRLRLPVNSKKIMTEATNSGGKQSAYFGATGKTRLEFADIEFSDDEDEIDWINRQQRTNHRGRVSNVGVGAGGGSGVGGGSTTADRHPPPLAKIRPSLAPVPSLFHSLLRFEYEWLLKWIRCTAVCIAKLAVSL